MALFYVWAGGRCTPGSCVVLDAPCSEDGAALSLRGTAGAWTWLAQEIFRRSRTSAARGGAATDDESPVTSETRRGERARLRPIPSRSSRGGTTRSCAAARETRSISFIQYSLIIVTSDIAPP